jgi:hypothetical protein
VHRVFANTFYWVALIHRKDASHKAVLWMEGRRREHDTLAADEVDSADN